MSFVTAHALFADHFLVILTFFIFAFVVHFFINADLPRAVFASIFDCHIFGPDVFFFISLVTLDNALALHECVVFCIRDSIVGLFVANVGLKWALIFDFDNILSLLGHFSSLLFGCKIPLVYMLASIAVPMHRESTGILTNIEFSIEEVDHISSIAFFFV